MYIIGGANWVTEQAEKRLWLFDPVTQASP